ncbi:MAG: selenocysteine-specific translation elongation factor [Acidimicrobiales bacterium]
MSIVATAGHVDHGKSTLVLALTGMDPDRFAEEKARGLTIDLGFAWATLPSGRIMAMIDVPGHVRFLKNMLAGLGGIDAALFVVAATEGWKPQSEEHLRILDLLGVQRGVVALTKVDLVDAETVELARMELADALAGTFLATAPVVEVAAPGRMGPAAGEPGSRGQASTGIDELARALDEVLAAAPAATDAGRPRLWVDRVFAARGSGTVVTGTLTSGALAVDDEVLVGRLSKPARIRSLQSLQQAHRSIGPGHRVAVNLAGVDRARLARGDALVRPGQWHRSRMVDANLAVLPGLDHPVSRRGAYQVYIGSGEHPARLRVLGPEELEPGSVGLVRLHLPAAVPLLPGDRFILRESGRDETVGGGEILDVDPVLPASRARPTRSVERVVAERGWVEAERLRLLTGATVAPSIGRWVVDPQVLEETRRSLAEAVAASGPLGLDTATLDEQSRAVLATIASVVVDAGRARPVGERDVLVDHPYLDALAGNLFNPPDAHGVDRAELREMIRRGLIIEKDGFCYSPQAVSEAARRLLRALGDCPQGLTVAQVRDLLGTTRRHVLPLLAHLDAHAATRRQGDFRVAGPKLAALADSAGSSGPLPG